MTSQKKSRLKIKLKNKSYGLPQCALYNVTTKKKLAELIGVDLAELKVIAKSEDAYNTFTDFGKNGKARDIQHPVGRLDIVHTRIASLVCRVKQPEYVHSGIKNRSHVSNASVHKEPNPVLVTDIRSFYESTNRKMVFNFFHAILKCAPDVSDLLADLCTYRGHIPTGSRLSMPIAYWANSSMFNALYALSCVNNINMSLFVDDIAFSGENVNTLFSLKIRKIISKYGHEAHPTKTILYKKDCVKVITGVAISGSHNRLLARNEHLKCLYQDMVLWRATIGDPQNIGVYNRLMGRLNSLAAIETKYKDKARSVKLRQRLEGD